MGKQRLPQRKRVPMPAEGTWFPVGMRIVHRCCSCRAVHRWSFRDNGGQLEVKIVQVYPKKEEKT